MNLKFRNINQRDMIVVGRTCEARDHRHPSGLALIRPIAPTQLCDVFTLAGFGRHGNP